jgi:hypothetical protein
VKESLRHTLYLGKEILLPIALALVLKLLLLKRAYGCCTPASVRNYIKRHPSPGRVVAEVVEQNLDLAEHKLLGFINEGNMTAVIFYLKTKGRERGYSRSRRFSRPRTSRAVGM